MYKIHIAIILEGKYWTTNKDKALNCVTSYLIYCGHMQFFNTTRKGLWHSSMFDQLPGGMYQLCSHGPIDDPFKKPLSTGRTTLNSMGVVVTGDKELQHVKCEFDKINKPKPKNPDKPKPSGQPKQQTKLNVEIHRIPVRRP